MTGAEETTGCLSLGEGEKEGASGEDYTEIADFSRKRKRKRVKKELYRFGNYHHYYGYRLGKTLDEDPRLKYFERDWFEGKDCLDIGCNEGLVTISVAQKYNCRSILGLDIDEVLIEKAKGNLSEEARTFHELADGGDFLGYGSDKEQLSESGDAVEKEWWKETIAWRDLQAKEPVGKEIHHSICAADSDQASSEANFSGLLRRVTFRKENFIKDFPHGDYMKDGTFDTVLCLSMTKWVHLNWGDEGLVRLFAKIYHVLRPDGILILEPQPWKSYKKKAHVSEVTRKIFNVVQLRPSHFTEILLDKRISTTCGSHLNFTVKNNSDQRKRLDSSLTDKSVLQYREAPPALIGRSFSILNSESWDEQDHAHGFRRPRGGCSYSSDFVWKVSSRPSMQQRSSILGRVGRSGKVILYQLALQSKRYKWSKKGSER